MLYATWAGSWAFLVCLALAGGLLAWEWGRLCIGRFEEGAVVLAVMAVAVAVAGQYRPLIGVALVLGAAGIAPMASSLGGRAALWLRVGAFYIGIPILALSWLRHHNRAIFLWLLLLVWATDIMAYLVGRTAGGPKLMPRVSPKKTWSGLVGGMLGAAGVGAVAAAYAGQPVVVLAAVSAGLAVCAQAGDLAESWVKRYFGVKDSSQLIPGHGGLLDRLDGLLAAAPAAVLLCLVDPQRFAEWS